MSMSVSIGVLGLVVLGAGAVLVGVRRSPGWRPRYVQAYARWYLLPARRGAATDAHVVHGISDWERVLNALRITVPHALCGVSLVAAPSDRGAPDGPDAVSCPRCVSRARWLVDAAPRGSR